ncbi:CRISPR-associated protein Csx16 [Aquibium microcysteis]|uniref:CRISPR-associated protein Csx16 n=1 Tax=Aquibium microcysteis TaxID=675281 RepID=UPI001AED7B4E|nr:CRISPR-associated protein Csx16 [Aquibium microcysteis]
MTRAGDDRSEICRKSGCPGGCAARLADVAAPDALAAALKRVVRAAGGAGGDGQTAGGFARGGPAALARLSGGLISGAYRPGGLRRFDIAKPDGRRRELAVPCVRDRIVQTALAEALDRQFDAGMSSGSFAYRKGLSVEHAAGLATLWRLRRLDHVGDAEIESFSAGDVVAGTLAVNVVARLNARGVRYLHLTLDLPPALRGKELTADDMDAAGARLEEYAVRRIG